MTDSPPASDLPWFRQQFAAKAGVPLGDVGMLPDQSHLDGGGYHCGSRDIKNIGKYHGPASAHVGASTEDYSVRQLKDRQYVDFELSHGSNFASAVDTPDGWGHGGNAAWIRWNNYVVADLRADPNRIPGLRGINFTPDGSVKKRYDSNNPGQGIIPSTDTVLWHTHLEWWRWSIMMRMAGFLRLLALMDDAIANRPARAPSSDDAVAAASTSGGSSMFRVMVQGGDGAVWLAGPNPLHIGPDLDADLGAGGVPLVRVNDVATLNAVLNCARVAPAQPLDPAAFAAALVPLLPPQSKVSAADLVTAINDPAVQATLTTTSFEGAQRAEKE